MTYEEAREKHKVITNDRGDQLDALSDFGIKHVSYDLCIGCDHNDDCPIVEAMNDTSILGYGDIVTECRFYKEKEWV